MPEIITRHPDIVLKVLRDGGAQCGVGAEQTILTGCPAEQFCALPSGELCVFGLDQVPQMTQVTRQELCTSHAGPGCGTAEATSVGALLVVAWGLRRVRKRRGGDQRPWHQGAR